MLCAILSGLLFVVCLASLAVAGAVPRLLALFGAVVGGAGYVLSLLKLTEDSGN